MATFYTSDLHFGHKLVAKDRGFGEKPDSPDRMNDMLIKNWCNTVKHDDLVFILGDIAVSAPTKAVQILSWLPGRKVLIAGNHDKCHPMYRDSKSQKKKYADVFEDIEPYGRRKIQGVEFLLCHFPYGADHTNEARFMQYRLPNLGMNLVHGHTHSTVKWTAPRQLHVGVDAWNLTPVPEQTVVDMLSAGMK